MKNIIFIAPLFLISAVFADETSVQEEQKRLNEMPAMEKPKMVDPDKASAWAQKKFGEPIYSKDGRQMTMYTEKGKFEAKSEVKERDFFAESKKEWENSRKHKKSDEKSKGRPLHIHQDPIGPYDPRDRDREESVSVSGTFTW